MRRRQLALAASAAALLAAGACLQFDPNGVYECDPAVEACADSGFPPIPPGPSDGSTGTDGSTSGDGGGGGGDAGDGGAQVDGGHPAERWCADYSAAVCNVALQCNIFSEAQRADCVEYFQFSFCLGNARAAARGFKTFDAAAADACLQKLSQPPMIDPDTGQCGFSTSCFPFAPNAGRGQLCSSSDDCIRDDDACGGPSCARTCREAGELGQPCNQSGGCDTGWCDPSTQTCVPPLPVSASCEGDRQCAPNAYCDGCSDGYMCQGVCTPYPEPGKPCRMDGYPYCGPDAYCDFGTNLCAKRGQVGDPCFGQDHCVGTAYCDYQQLICRPRGSTGALCTYSSDCIETLACIQGVCGTPRGENQSCADYDDCDAAQNLSCDDITRTCREYESVDAGAACTDDTIRCNTGTCKGEAENPDGGAGTFGTCQQIAVGDPCVGTYSCGPGQYCSTSSSTQSTCQAAGQGTPCSYSENCLDGYFCSSSGTCAPQRLSGQPCSKKEQGECRATVCRAATPDAGTGTCGARSTTGGPCVHETDCLTAHECVSGTCQRIGIIGTSCYSSVCFTGACQKVPDAGSVCAPRLDGGTCFWDGDCLSATCEGVCAPVCE